MGAIMLVISFVILGRRAIIRLVISIVILVRNEDWL